MRILVNIKNGIVIKNAIQKIEKKRQLSQYFFSFLEYDFGVTVVKNIVKNI